MPVELTPYESFISLPFFVQLLVVGVPLAAITIVLTIRTWRQGGESRMNDNVSTAIIRFAGAAFVFLGAFAIVTAWQSSTSITNDVSREFAAISSIDQDTGALDVPEAQALRQKLVDYASVVVSEEVGTQGDMVVSESASTLVYDIQDAAYELSQSEYYSDKEVDSLYKDVETFKQARNARIAHTWPLVPESIMWALLSMGLLMVVVASLYPSGPSRMSKWLQSVASLVVVVVILGTVLQLQSGDVAVTNFTHPADVFLATHTAQ